MTFFKYISITKKNSRTIPGIQEPVNAMGCETRPFSPSQNYKIETKSWMEIAYTTYHKLGKLGYTLFICHAEWLVQEHQIC